MGVNIIVGALATLFLAVSLYFLGGIRRESPDWHYDFESPASARFLIGAVYIGVAVLCVWAFLHGHRAIHQAAVVGYARDSIAA